MSIDWDSVYSRAREKDEERKRAKTSTTNKTSSSSIDWESVYSRAREKDEERARAFNEKKSKETARWSSITREHNTPGDEGSNSQDNSVQDNGFKMISYQDAMANGPVIDRKKALANPSLMPNSDANVIADTPSEWDKASNKTYKQSAARTAEQHKEQTSAANEYNTLGDDVMAEVKIMAEGLNAEPMTKGLTGLQVAMFGGEEYGKYMQRIADGKEARKRLIDKGYTETQVDMWAKMQQEGANQQYAADLQQGFDEMAEEHPVLSSLASVGVKLSTTPLDAATKIDEAASGNINTNGIVDISSQTDDMIRSSVAKDIEEESKIGAWLYNVGMSGVDSAVASVMPGGFLFLATDAATSTMRDLTNRGLSTEQAFFGGVAAGVFEGLFEKVSIGNFKALQEVSPSSVKDVVKNLLKSSGVNASEEAATELANIIYDTIAHGDLSQLNMLAEKYDGNYAKAFGELALQVGEAGLSGAVMGGGFGVTGSAIGYASNYGDIKATGQAVKADGKVDAVLQQAANAPKNSSPQQAYQRAQKKIDKGKSLSDRDVGLVATTSARYIQENAPELNGVFKSAKTKEDVEAIYNAERYRIENSPSIPKEAKSAIKALEADYKLAKASIENYNLSGARAMSDSARQSMTETDTVKTKMPTIGKTEAGEVISVSSIENVEDGKITVKTSEGITQALDIKKDIKSVDAQTLWTNAAQSFPDADSAQAYIDNYDGGSIADYTKAFKDYYNLAATGLSLERINEQNIAPYYDLTEQAQAAAVEMGRKSMQFQQGVVDLSVTPKTKAQQLQMNMLDEIGKHTGLNFVVVDKMKDEGFYKTGSNQIVLSLGSSKGLMLRTAGHETYHYVQTALPDNAKEIETFALDTLKKNKGEKWVNDRLKYYEKLGYEGKQKQIDELVADSLYDVFTNKRAVEQFAEKNQSVAQKISNHIKQLIADIKNILNKLKASGDYAEIKAWQDDVASLEKLNNMFLDTLDELAAKKADNTAETKNTAEAVMSKNRDADYMTAVENGDMETAQRMVDEAAEEAMPNSVIRDDDGKLLKVYHGSPNKFTVFNPNKLNANGNAHGRGFYFTEEKSMAEGYSKEDGQLLSGYLNITNPMSEDKVTIKKSDLLKLIKATCEAEAKQLVADGGYDNVSDALKDTWVSNYVYTYGTDMNRVYKEVTDIVYDNDSDVQIIAEMTNVAGAENVLKNVYEFTGYDGVVYTNDRGTHEFVALTSNQFKSADPVTYDDNGNVIPLSERFDKNQEDIRYSRKRLTNQSSTNYTISRNSPLSSTDRAKPNPRSSINWVYQAGLFSVVESKLFHQKISEINQGSQAFRKDADGNYMLPIENKIVFTDGNYDAPEIIKIVEFMSDSETNISNARRLIYRAEKGESSYEETRQILEDLFGYGFVYQYNIGDDKAYEWANERSEGRNRRTVISNYYRMQNRESDFAEDENLQDITTSTKRELSISEEASDYILDTKEYREILDIVDQRFEATGRKELSPKAIDRLAGRLLTKSKSNYSREQLTERLTALFDYIANSQDLEWSEVTSIAAEISKDILKESQTLDRSMQTEYADVLKLMRESKVYISPEVKQEIAYSFGSYDSFRRMLGNKLKVTVTDTSAVPLDVFWRELSENRPEMFDADTNYLDMPSAIADFLDMTSPQYINPYDIEMDMDEAAYDFALQIYDEYFNIPEVISEAKKHQHEIERLKSKYNAKINELHNTYRERIKKLRNEKNNKIEATKALYRQRHEAYREKRNETQNKQKLRSSIYRTSKALVDKLVKPTDQKHIPRDLIPLVNDFAKTITESRIFSYSKTNKLLEMFEKSPDIKSALIVREDFIEDLRRMREIVDGKRLSELSVSELKFVKEIAFELNHMVVEGNKLFAENKRVTVTEQGNKIYEEFDKQTKGKKRIQATSRFKLLNEAQIGILKPQTFFELLESPTLLGAYHNLENAQYDWVVKHDNIKDIFTDYFAKYDYDKWWKKIIEVKISDRIIPFTMDEALSIYALSKRPDAARHLLGGGFVKESEGLSKFKDYVKNHKGDFDKESKGSPKKFLQSLNSISIHLRETDIRNVIDAMRNASDGKAIQYADAVVKYMSTDMAKQGNKATMTVYGREKFNEDYYFPIISDPNHLHFEAAKGIDQRMSSQSFTKATTDYASNPIVVGSFTETAVKHCEDMATYASFLAPISDFTRLYNYKYLPDSDVAKQKTPVRSKIQEVYGVKATKYIEQMLKDVNGGVVQGTGAGTINTLVGRVKRDAVLGSFQVVIQQPSAYLRASAELSFKHILYPRLKAFSPAMWDELKQYAPVARIKEIGGFDTNMGKTASEDVMGKYANRDKWVVVKARDKVNDILGKAPELMDRWTWVAIWQATKSETQKKHPDLAVGSKEFLRKAGERFTYIVNETQVYDSVFSRSHWLRSRDSGVKQILSFKNEQLTTFNMLYKAMSLPGNENRGKARIISRVVVSVMSTIVFNGILKSLTGAIRDDDDEKSFIEKYLGKLVNNILMDTAGVVPFFDEFVNLLQSGFESTEMTDEYINRLVETIRYIFDTDKDVASKIKMLVSYTGLITGIPTKNLWREANSIKNIYKSIVENEPTTSKGVKYSILDEIDFATFKWLDVPNQTEQLVLAYLEGDTEHFEKTRANIERKIVANNKNGDLSKEDLASEVSSKIKTTTGTLYKKSKITKEQASKILKNLFDLEEDDIYWQIQEWDNADNDDWSKYSDFVNAVDSGEKLDEIISDYYDHGADKASLSSALSSYYKDKYLSAYETNPKAVDEIESKMLKAYEALGYDYDEHDIYWKFESWKHSDDDDWSKYGDFYSAIDSNKNVRATIKSYIDHGVTTKTLASEITKHYKEEYINLYNTDRVAASKLKSKLVEVYALLGYKRADKSKDIDAWLKPQK